MYILDNLSLLAIIRVETLQTIVFNHRLLL